MGLDTNKIDAAVLALLYLGLHDGVRAWKGFDWDAMDRLYQRGYITDPRGKAKSVVFTEEGLQHAEFLLQKLFGYLFSALAGSVYLSRSISAHSRNRSGRLRSRPGADENAVHRRRFWSWSFNARAFVTHAALTRYRT